MPAGADELKPLVDVTAGATGALLTNIMLSPVDIAKTRMQTGRSKDGVLETIREIVEADGVAGCFKGIGLKSVETVLPVLQAPVVLLREARAWTERSPDRGTVERRARARYRDGILLSSYV